MRTLRSLKVDLHLHTAEDPLHTIEYTAKELISKAADEGFDVLAITNHHCITFNRSLASYARERGILLIPGVEITIRNRHILLLNPPHGRIPANFSSLSNLRNPETLIIAPHPYFPNPHSLNGLLLKHLKLFDAIEYCHFYSPRINFNHLALRVSRCHGLPLIGNSDAHFPDQFGTTYSLIHAEKDPSSIFAAIRKGKLEVMTRPLTSLQMGSLLGRFLTMALQRQKIRHGQWLRTRWKARRSHLRFLAPYSPLSKK